MEASERPAVGQIRMRQRVSTQIGRIDYVIVRITREPGGSDAFFRFSSPLTLCEVRRELHVLEIVA